MMYTCIFLIMACFWGGIQAMGAAVSPLSAAARALFAHVYANDVNKLRAALKPGVDVNVLDTHDISPLSAAALKGHTQCMQLLIDRGADVHKVNKNGWTSLHYAAQKGKIESLRVLLDNGAVVNARADEGLTPLIMVLCMGYTDCARLLLDRGADTRLALDEGTSPLGAAIDGGHTECLRLLLARGADVNAQSLDGWVPLHQCAHRGYGEYARLLCARGADISARTKEGCTPLFIAALEGNHACLKVLLEEGADVNLPNNEGMTPLYAAARDSHVECVRLLLEYGADPNKSKDGWTPLFLTVENNDSACARLLIEKGANPNIQARDGSTPLYIAVYKGHMDCVRLLIANGADVTIANNHRSIPLHVAVYKGNAACFNELIHVHKKHADINLDAMRLAGRFYLLIYAIKNNLTEVALCLLDHGATHRISDKNGISAFEWACKTWNDAVVKRIVPGRDPNQVIAEYFEKQICGARVQASQKPATTSTGEAASDELSDSDCDELEAATEAVEGYEDDELFAEICSAQPRATEAPARAARPRVTRSAIKSYHGRVAQWFINSEAAFTEQGYCTPGHAKYTSVSEKERVIRHHTFPRIIDSIVTQNHCIGNDNKKCVYRVYGSIIYGRTAENGSFTYALAKEGGVGCYHRSFSHKQQLPADAKCCAPDAALLAKLQAQCNADRYAVAGNAQGIVILDKETKIMYKIFYIKTE